jgi:hypothetical protein
LTIDAEWGTDDLDRAQPHQTRKRRAVLARYRAMAEAGVPFPATEDPGLAAVSYREGSPEWTDERSGTAERLGRGSHRRS